jgi:hypothetical protein
MNLRYVFIFLALFPLIGFGQQPEMLRWDKVQSRLPKGFSISDSIETFIPLKEAFIDPAFRRLISEDRKVIIYTTVLLFDTVGTDFIRRHFNPSYDRKYNYKNTIKCKIDSVNGKVSYFKGDTLKKYNATVAGVYKIRLDFPYHKVYNNAKVVFFYKDRIGDLELIYFYQDDVDIDKYIERSAFSFKFK